MANAGTVTVDFAAEVAKFNAQMKQVNDRVKSVESGFKKMSGVVESALKIFSVGIAVNFIRSAADAADQLGKTADKLGVSTERLTAFQLAAADAGVETGTLNKLLTDAQRRLGDAANGTGEALRVLQSLNLNVRDLQRLAPDELFLRYADAIGSMANRSDQFSAAQALFGRAAQEAFTLIEAGRPAIEEAAATVNRLGLALSRVDIFKIEQANDKLGLLARTSQAFGQQVAAALAPFVTEFVDRLTGAGVAVDDTRGKLDAFARGVFVAFEIVANGARVFDAAISTAVLGIAKAVETANAILRSGFELTARLDEAVGLDALAERFSRFAASAGEAESFAAALAENAAKRIEDASRDVKKFSEIFEEADQIVQRAQDRAEEAARRQAEINETLRLGLGGEVEVEAFNASNLVLEDLQSQHYERMLQLQREFLERSAELSEQLDVREFVRHQTFREQAAIEAEQAILQARQNAFDAAQGLLQSLSARSKTAAIALVAINKAVAIAQAIQNTGAAVMKTLAFYGGTPAGYAAAAAVKAWGAVEVGLIAATGLAQIQQIRSSPGAGAPIGSPTNPVFTDTSTENQIFGVQQRPQVNITVEGVITPGSARALAEAIRDVVDTSDVHIIGPNSSQARELRGE